MSLRKCTRLFSVFEQLNKEGTKEYSDLSEGTFAEFICNKRKKVDEELHKEAEDEAYELYTKGIELEAQDRQELEIKNDKLLAKQMTFLDLCKTGTKEEILLYFVRNVISINCTQLPPHNQELLPPLEILSKRKDIRELKYLLLCFIPEGAPLLPPPG